MLPSDGVKRADRSATRLVIAALACATLLACEPTIRVEAPKEPITINLNIKLEAEVRVKLEEEAKQDIKANPGIF